MRPVPGLMSYTLNLAELGGSLLSLSCFALWGIDVPIALDYNLALT